MNQKLERLPEKLTVITVMLIGMIVAAFAGSQTGHGQAKWILIMIGAVMLTALAVKLGEKSWLLIPVFMGFGGAITGLPLNFALKDLVILYVFGVFLVLRTVKIVRRKPVYGFVDVLLLVNLIWLGTAYIRNPVGVLGFYSDRIGGKPYFNVAIACMAYWVLGRVRLSPKAAYWLPLWMLIGPAFDAVAGTISQKLPLLGGKLAAAYSIFGEGMSPSGAPAVVDDSGFGESRLTRLGTLGGSAFSTACSYWHPLTCINPLYAGRFLALLISTVLILLSGFRSAIFGAGLFFLVAGWLRTKWDHVFKCLAIGIPLLALLIAGQGTLYKLPLSAQRALCFLPGHWDYAAVSDAKGSTEWRVEMWKDALTTDIYIKDKWFGDGFGVDRVAWQAVQTAQWRDIPQRIRAEHQAIMGGFHSGPISTIRVTGYIGLGLFYLLMCVMARHAWQLVKRARNTPYYPLTLVIGIPIVLTPLVFVVIFGAYDSDLPKLIYLLGMLNMLRLSLKDYLAGHVRTGIQGAPQARNRPVQNHHQLEPTAP